MIQPAERQSLVRIHLTAWFHNWNQKCTYSESQLPAALWILWTPESLKPPNPNRLESLRFPAKPARPCSWRKGVSSIKTSTSDVCTEWNRVPSRPINSCSLAKRLEAISQTSKATRQEPPCPSPEMLTGQLRLFGKEHWVLFLIFAGNGWAVSGRGKVNLLLPTLKTMQVIILTLSVILIK